MWRLIFGLGAAAIWVCARQVVQPAWYEWLVVPIAFGASNVFEWWIHKYVMHHPVKGLMGIYNRHTLAHHQFFTDAEEPTRWIPRAIFASCSFPPYALVAFMSLSLAPAAILGLLGAANAGWLLLITNTALYLNYELFHYCCHVKDDRLVRRIPLVNSIPASPYRAPQSRDHDGAQFQPDLSGGGLVLRHVRTWTVDCSSMCSTGFMTALPGATRDEAGAAVRARAKNKPQQCQSDRGGIAVGIASMVLWTWCDA